MKRLNLYLTLIFCVLALLILSGYIKVYAQTPPPITDLKFAAYISTNVPETRVGVPKSNAYQRTARSVNDCGLTANDMITKVCMSVWATEPLTDTNIAHVWVNCSGTSKETGTTGTFSSKVSKGSLQKCVVDTPPGYGRRPLGAPGAEFKEALTKFTVSNGHVIVIVEMLKR